MSSNQLFIVCILTISVILFLVLERRQEKKYIKMRKMKKIGKMGEEIEIKSEIAKTLSDLFRSLASTMLVLEVAIIVIVAIEVILKMI